MQLSTDKLSKSALENINTWLSEPKYAEYRLELQDLINQEQWQVLEDAFFKVIEFGTAGRRGVTGVGSNRINRVTIGESAQALCAYALQFDSHAAEKGVVIACDTRISSPELTRFAAQVTAAQGFKTYIFDSFRSTPELSFAVRHLGCVVGIVISASHNPPSDNGFKAYWSDGAQLASPHDTGVLAVAETIHDIDFVDYEDAISEGRIEILSKEVDDAYIKAVVHEAIGTDRDVKIIYSPLHGAGQTNVLPSLKAAGFKNVQVVSSQMVPDGRFPTIENGKPNPQDISANDLAVAQMMSENADIAITNDPDADRIGVVVRQGDVPIYLNGNQSAILVADYVLGTLQKKGHLSDKHYIAKTIVTTDMLDTLANYYGVNVYGDMLIGFKYIGKLIREKEETDELFVMGAEESYGLLKGTYARDKDGATGALSMAEYAAELKKSGKTLYDRLIELFATHGLYIDQLNNLMCPGASGFEQMKRIMDGLRKSPPLQLGKDEITAVLDYKTLKRKDILSGSETTIDCVSGNVIVFEFGDRRKRITVRPSGTEPNIKLYVQWYEDADGSRKTLDQYEDLEVRVNALSKQFEGLLLEF